MIDSPGRIATTHVGSLPRSAAVTRSVVRGRARRTGRRRTSSTQVLTAAVDDAVRRQVEAGIDLISDGEMAKISYATYIKDRITGFDGDSPRRAAGRPRGLPGLPAAPGPAAAGRRTYRRPRCVGEVRPATLAPLEADLRRFAEARARHGDPAGFMNAASPGVIALFQPNDFYPDDDAYLEALAEAMRPEYEAIVAAGLVLQLDSPDLGLGRHMMYKDRDDEEYLRLIERHVAVLNHALRNVPADRARMHVCWGNYEGPHHRDVEMAVILPTLLTAKPAGLLFETANPRHQHDLEAFVDASEPDRRRQGLDPGRHRLDHELHRAPAGGGESAPRLRRSGRVPSG